MQSLSCASIKMKTEIEKRNKSGTLLNLANNLSLSTIKLSQLSSDFTFVILTCKLDCVIRGMFLNP